MTTIELEAKKAEFVRSILNDVHSEKVLNKLLDFYEELTVEYPCQHTDEEILESCEKAMKAYEDGELIPHEQIRKKHTA